MKKADGYTTNYATAYSSVVVMNINFLFPSGAVSILLENL
jgi:hypothetical protein